MMFFVSLDVQKWTVIIVQTHITLFYFPDIKYARLCFREMGIK